MADPHETVKTIGDTAAVTTAVGGFLTQNLPTIALIISIIWTLLRIYEMDTVQKLLGRKVEVEHDEEAE